MNYKIPEFTDKDTLIQNLGPCKYDSPLSQHYDETLFSTDDDRILYDITYHGTMKSIKEGKALPSFECAGPRKKIFFNPATTKAGIVTCGGLCPGLNDIIRNVVMGLTHAYGVHRIYGFRYGYAGLVPDGNHEPILLDPEIVSNIHMQGGTILSSSRGQQDTATIVDTLQRMGIDILFVVGGDGTLRAAHEISDECNLRGLKKSIIGIPKTIDNDIILLDKSFGFESAVTEAVKAINCAHVEAKGAPNGIGIVKLMGRDSGFIAAYASCASSEANFVLVPEVPLVVDGPGGFLEALRKRITSRDHALIVVAEGAGQNLFTDSAGVDASGNKLHNDIGKYLRDRIKADMKEHGIDATIKYIDPSYIIRSIPANAYDNSYCSHLAHNAVHAGMAGKTGMVVAMCHRVHVHLPLALIATARKRLNTNSELWRGVIESTGQPLAWGKSE
ncbi:MAG: ATP-dependent 6-phosphofructokinase [Opitutales bacterium]|nr:ATP-dependent 6-phosphofructokinase [Opitutales bacterium]